MISFNGSIPEIADWDAGEGCTKDSGKTVGGNGGQDDPTGDSHPLADEDSKVLDDDRGLDEEQTGVV